MNIIRSVWNRISWIRPKSTAAYTGVKIDQIDGNNSSSSKGDVGTEPCADDSTSNPPKRRMLGDGRSEPMDSNSMPPTAPLSSVQGTVAIARHDVSNFLSTKIITGQGINMGEGVQSKISETCAGELSNEVDRKVAFILLKTIEKNVCTDRQRLVSSAWESQSDYSYVLTLENLASKINAQDLSKIVALDPSYIRNISVTYPNDLNNGSTLSLSITVCKYGLVDPPKKDLFRFVDRIVNINSSALSACHEKMVLPSIYGCMDMDMVRKTIECETKESTETKGDPIANNLSMNKDYIISSLEGSNLNIRSKIGTDVFTSDCEVIRDMIFLVYKKDRFPPIMDTTIKVVEVSSGNSGNNDITGGGNGVHISYIISMTGVRDLKYDFIEFMFNIFHGRMMDMTYHYDSDKFDGVLTMELNSGSNGNGAPGRQKSIATRIEYQNRAEETASGGYYSIQQQKSAVSNTIGFKRKIGRDFDKR